MTQNKLEKGFTLLEVMIALAVLSISMLGIYSLQNMSLKTLRELTSIMISRQKPILWLRDC